METDTPLTQLISINQENEETTKKNIYSKCIKENL